MTTKTQIARSSLDASIASARVALAAISKALEAEKTQALWGAYDALNDLAFALIFLREKL